ncbi:hypothetical protein PYCC9005_001424 [Savitreella phatthalungensis]
MTVSIEFTLDTICPYTYLARKSLRAALAIVQMSATQVRAFLALDETESPPGIDLSKFPLPMSFEITYKPFFLAEGLKESNKYEWYLAKCHGDRVACDEMICAMQARARTRGIELSYDGTVSHTLHAHRTLQWVQAYDKRHADRSLKTYGLATGKTEAFMEALYRLYFEESRPPASAETLQTAVDEAGLTLDVHRFLKGDEYADQVEQIVRENRMNGIDAVPDVLVIGRRRDFHLVGNKDPLEYVRTFAQLFKEL